MVIPEIRVAGSAGQHIRSAVSVIGELAVACGAFAASQDDFPITVRKGFSISDLILDNQPICYTGVDRPELLIVLSPDGLLRLGALNDLMPHALIVAADNLDLGNTGGIVHRINVRRLQDQTGRGLEALAALAYGIVAQKWIAGEALLAAARHCLSGQYRDARLKAIECGIRLLQNKGDTTCTVQ